MMLGLASAAALAALPAAAQASWSDAQLVSVDNARLEQADGASTAVDVSGDGRWVVLQTKASNFYADDDPDAPGRLRQGGIFRFDRATGVIALVADGDQVDEGSGELLLRGANAPSVSDDGRYVVFATAQRLAAQDDNDNVDVYVRDMALPIGVDRAASGAYTLVSARSGGDEPAHYAAPATPFPGGDPGSAVFAGQAISADGRYVAFRTAESTSDLPDRPALDTPPGSVFVRDLLTKRTALVTARLDGTGAAGGALTPVVLSRDGSTVAWVGENGPLQTRMLAGESGDNAQRYYLWRRWNDPDATTRRVTGNADPDDPACPEEQGITFNPTAVGPCYGPLTDAEGTFGDIGGRAPALSADGWTVAFLTTAGSRPAAADDGYLDAFVTSMRPGLTRKSATRAVTKGTTAANARANGDIESLAMSADGNRLAIVSSRREFLPPAPPMLSDVRASPPLSSELYVLDLAGGGAIRRPSMPGGGEVNGTVDAGAAISADGRVLAFITRSSNLIWGDANELPDVFAVTETDDVQTAPPPIGLGEDPIDLDVGGDADELIARVSSRRDGSLLLRVTAPEAGGLRAVARTRPVKAARRSARGRGAKTTPRPRQVAAVRGRARRPTTVRLVLSLRGRDRSAVRRGTPLPVRVAVTLAPARRGARARTVTVSGTFRVPKKASTAQPSKARRTPLRRKNGAR
jgi:Tol biopolymer transport system component